ncbi:AAA ATPase midasin [Tilletia horrida]|nr:AAA ATPase midasin [Tilletia horrida]
MAAAAAAAVAAQEETRAQAPVVRGALELDLDAAAQRAADELQRLAPNALKAQQIRARLLQLSESSDDPHTKKKKKAHLLDALSDALLVPQCTCELAILLRPILVDLTARWLSSPADTHSEGQEKPAWTQERTQNILHAFARLLYPLEEVYDCLHLFLTQPELEGKHLLDVASDEASLQALLVSAWRLLYASPSLIYYLKFPLLPERLSALWEDRATYTPATRLLAIKIFAQLVGLPPATRAEYERKWVGEVSFSDYMSLELRNAERRKLGSGARDAMDVDDADAEELGVRHSGVEACAAVYAEGGLVEELDLWILPYLELQRTQAVWARFPALSPPFLTLQAEGSVPNALETTDLHQLVAHSAGVLLVRHGSSAPSSSDAAPTAQPGADDAFIETVSAHSTLFQLALLAGHRRPMLLTGAPGCGKTSLINHFCDQIASDGADRTILTIQLGDQSGIDAKQLLGSFISSPTNPGAFEWREGALTRAVRLGMWVVLEDIDRATTDVLQVIGQLVEGLTDTRDIGRRPMLDLGNRGKVRAGKNFQLFATRSVAPIISAKSRAQAAKDTYPSASFLGAGHWAEVCMAAPDEKDITDIVDAHSPTLAAGGLSAHMISAWKRVQAFGSQTESTASPSASAANAATPAAGSRRTITLRDLLKWCERTETYLHEAGAQGGGDVFSHTSHRERVLVEACDVFLSSIPAPSLSANAKASAKGKAVDRYSALVHILADALNLSNEQAWSALRDRIPNFAIQTAASGQKTIRLGRAKLARSDSGQALDSALSLLTGATVPISQNFAMTKTSLVMLEQIAMAASQAEPILLVGETGTGKTTLVQHLASLLQKPLVALNLSQQTESGDLLGGFKPLDPKIPASEVHNIWTVLFQRTFSAKRNGAFIDAERKAFTSAKWKRLIGLWRESARMAAGRKRRSAKAQSNAEAGGDGDDSESRKRRKTEKGKTAVEDDAARQRQIDEELDAEWKEFEGEIDAFEAQHASKRKNFVFSFVEGPLVHALRNGHWILLDEINLAASEVLHCLSGLLQSPTSSVTLTDRGDTVPIVRHPDFRLFACMNPATDVGKKDLAMSLRQRFTELYIPSPDADIDALTSIVDKYIGQLAVGDRGVIMDAAETYAQIQRLSRGHELADGANQRPHYSVRTLSRALRFAADTSRVFGLRRALYEGFVMAFSMLLESASLAKLIEILQRHIIARAKNPRQVASLVPSMPTTAGKDYVQVGAFWLETGSSEPENVDNYVLTPSVQEKLIGLARAVMTRKYPVLIQGPTSAGKTSAIEYLAKRTGHAFVRINNHEHTDVQEYLGTYATDSNTGQLVFREGLLVNALRHGHWIVLDELNLAPTDVLEALNRLLDDNRELIIPETGEVVRPHPHFMLFATQNPPGLYAGRKVLSRAFRNRFLEIHFDDVPQPELQTILADRCSIAPSYAAKMVAVFVELQKRRQTGRVFDTKQAFVTLRDLFRWGQREAVGYQVLAENGYMLIAERARRSDDKAIVKEVLEEVMNVSINVDKLYDIGSKSARVRLGSDVAKRLLSSAASSQVVWTKAMTRLLYLISAAFRNNEPVLLVGETGTGKTSVCEAISTACGKALHTVNCHQNTDSADLLGGQRPLRNRSARRAAGEAQARAILTKLVNSERVIALASAPVEDLLAELNAQLKSWTAEKEALVPQSEASEARNSLTESIALFEWNDGPLVEAMRAGDHILLDEISLADDSVLERLNSVLESGRTLVLTDGFVSDRKDKNDGVGSALLVAADGFQFAATMNPGGDYGKKELSPALRNRFTEIWVPHVDEREDLLSILGSRWAEESLKSWSESILDFAVWINTELAGHPTMGIRDMIAWVVFMNNTCGSANGVLTPEEAYVHGALLTVVDGLGTIPATAHMSRLSVGALRQRCLQRLSTAISPAIVEACAQLRAVVKEEEALVRFGAFPLLKRAGSSFETSVFSLTASSPALNAMRVVRGLCVPQKAILLEGSPGAGKTSLITALARASRTPLTRINLSDQTELVDLFGSDLPVEGGGPGEFAWKDAAFLRAMVRGEWVLLDEMNLASQSVLEGLNSCLDHRGTVYVPELGRSFDKHPDFRIFAAQNPIGQGGGRKGLPQSFLNRFTKVYVHELTDSDMLSICREVFDYVDPALITDMITFNGRLQEATMTKATFGRNGMPWEFNLRDVLRWMLLLPKLSAGDQRRVAVDRMRSMYLDRFRSEADRSAAWQLFESVFGAQDAYLKNPIPSLHAGQFQIGCTALPSLRNLTQETNGPTQAVLQKHLAALDTLADSVQYGRLSILIGPSGSGKTSCVKALAAAAGVALEEIRMSPGMDTTDLLGSFEQEDPATDLQRLAKAHLARIADKIAKGVADTQGLNSLLSVRAGLERFIQNEIQDSTGLSDLESDIRAADLDTEEFRELSGFLEAAERLSSGASQGSRRFRWSDGPFLRALKEGRWLLLDDANLCPASVLDRFNSLFEDRGSLVLSERGMVDGEVPVFRPHPKFRAFMTIDPRHGELSRAMRNRGIEVCLPGRDSSRKTSSTDDLRLHFLKRQPFQRTNALKDHSFEALGLASRRGAFDVGAENIIPLSNGCLAHTRMLVEDPELYHPLVSSISLDLPEEESASGDFETDARALQALITCDDQPRRTAHLVLTLAKDPAARLVQETMDQDRIEAIQRLGSITGSPLATKILEAFVATLLQQVRLLRIPTTFALEQASNLPVLARSALLSNTDDDLESNPEDVLYPLLVALARLLQSLIHKAQERSLDIDALTSIFDFSVFLQHKCMSEHLDYSLLAIAQKQLQVMIAAAQYAIEGPLQAHFAAVTALLGRLANKVTLRRGVVMHAIWQLFLVSHILEAAQPIHAKLLQELRSSVKVRSNDAIRTAIDLAATIASAQSNTPPSQLTELVDLADRSVLALRTQNTAAVDEEDDDTPISRFARHTETFKFAVSSLLADNALVNFRSAIPTIHSTAMQRFVDLYCASAAVLPDAVVRMRALAWSGGRMDDGQTSETTKAILAQLDFASDLETLDADVGLGQIFRPVFLQSTLASGQISMVSLRDIDNLKQIKQRSAQMLSVALAAQAQTVSERLSFALADFVGLCVHSIAVESEVAAVRDLAAGLGASIPDVPTLQRQLDAVDCNALAKSAESSAIQHWLTCLRQVCKVLLQPAQTRLSSLGSAFIKVAQASLQLYWPNVPLDPLAPTRVEKEFADIRIQRLTARLSVSRTFEQDVSGNVNTALQRRLQKDIADVKAQQASVGAPALQRHSDLQELAQLHRDTLAFLQQVLDDKQIDGLLKEFMSNFSATGEARAATLRSSISNFRSRLPKIGNGFADVWQPLLSMLDLMSTGLAALLEGARQDAASKSAKLALDVVRASTGFPSVHAAGQIQSILISNRSGSARLGLSLFLLGLHSILALPSKAQKEPQQLRLVDGLYSQIFGIWAAERTKKQQEAAEAASIYKSRKEEITIPSPDELEEQDFQALFPDYGDGLTEVAIPAPDFLGDADAKVATAISAEHKQELVALHLAMTGHGETPSITTRKEDLLKQLVEKHYPAFPQDLDHSSALFQMGMHIRWIHAVQSQSAKEFYREPNPAEVQQAVPVVVELREHLAKLLLEWPDQLVLQHIQDRCDAILNLRADLPTARILSALELLLAHTDDWESYANSKTSLRLHREKITALIINWRRLELSSWPALLDYAAKQQVDLVADWWFSFYETVVLGSADAEEKGQEALDKHIGETIQLVDGFMRSSTLGQFESRLILVQSFAGFFSVRAVDSNSSSATSKMARILGNLHSYFEQAAPKVKAALDRQRKALEQDITTFAKLASWKDVNIHALKQSAQKSHRRLHKTIRKFRDILRQPVDPILAEHATPKSVDTVAGKAQAPVLRERLAGLPASTGFEWSEGKGHLANLERTLGVLHQLSRDQLDTILGRSAVEGLHALGIEIIQRTQQLSKATPARLTEENTKLVKQLTVRKQRAWTDFLKEQRRIGLSAYQNPQKTVALNDPVALYGVDRPDLDIASDALRRSLQRAEQYHWRLLTSIPRSHDALQQRSEDVPISDLLKGIHYVEHGALLALGERARLSETLRHLQGIDAIVSALERLDDTPDGQAHSLSAGEVLCFSQLEIFLAQAIQTLKEVESAAFDHQAAALIPEPNIGAFKASLNAHINKVQSVQDEFTLVARHVTGPSSTVLPKRDEKAVQHISEAVEAVCIQMDAFGTNSPALSTLCLNTTRWMRGSLAHALSALQQGAANGHHDEVESLQACSSRVINSVLQIAQDVRALSTGEVEQDASELADSALPTQCHHLRAVHQQLRAAEVSQQLVTLVRAAASKGSSREEATYALRRVAPFVAVYADLIKQHLYTSSEWYGELLKYLYIVNQTVQSVITQGFCKPKEEQESSEDQKGADNTEGGTGLADGSGAQDITDQLEDDEEIEELQRDEDAPQDDQGETEKQKGAKESGLDLDGPTEEKETDEAEEEKPEDEEDQDEGDDMDDAIENVDPLDPNAVDEKMWDGDHDDKKEDGGELQDDQAGNPEDDLSAPKNESGPDAQDKLPEKKDGKDEPQDAENNEAEQAEGEEGDQDVMEEEVDGEEEAEDGAAKEAPQMEDIQSGEVLEDIQEFPDGGDQEADADEDMNDADELEDLSDLQPDKPDTQPDDMDFDEEDPGQEDILPDDGKGEDDAKEVDPIEEGSGLVQDGEDGEDGDEQDDDEAPGAQDEPEQALPQDNLQQMDGADGDKPETAEDAQPQTSVMDSTPDVDSSAQMDRSSAAVAGKQTKGATADQQTGAQAEQADASQDPSQPEPNNAQPEDGAGNESGAPVPNQSDVGAEQATEPDEQSRANPIRSLGDALQEFRRRLDDIQNASEAQEEEVSEQKKEDGQAFPETGEVEHVAHDQDADAQALGAAEDSEVQRLDASAIQDDTKRDDSAAAAHDVPEQKPEPPQLEELEPDRRSAPDSTQKGALLSSEVQPDRANIERDVDHVIADPQDDDEREPMDAEQDVQAAEGPTTEPERAEADAALQSELALLQSAGEEARVLKAAELWTAYTTLTADLSLALCEQLRLILAPTLASRLNGDFRTGKRLNMRKIIPFIASDFAKDKIWLRRTKPSAREYQVLLALDDSKSMSETRSAHLAYQTLALVTGALARLEVGDVSVCRFGAEVETLHDFGKGAIGQQDGARIVERLSFQQRSTNVLRLVEDSLRILAEAREKNASTSSTAAELWQLQIIVSDGVCQDHAKLRALLRKATEQRVMLVFVVVDALHQQQSSAERAATAAPSNPTASAASADTPRNSILTMQQVSYQMGADGKLDMKLERYLDTFPFEYYVVVRDVEALPDVLAETLRQWAEKIREGS